MVVKLIEFAGQFFPNNCISCGKRLSPRRFLCDSCEALIKGPIPYEISLGKFSARSYWWYEPPVSDVIKAYKFAKRWRLSKLIANWLLYLLDYSLHSESSDYAIVSVPTTLRALRERGFDSNGLVLRQLRKIVDYRVIDAITVAKSGLPQSSLSKEERKAAAIGKFTLRTERLPEKIILFDDFITTGSTITSCANLLKSAGVKDLKILSIARTK
ncbi:MAG: ComF family protein [Thermotogae bacterium]|nr:MAG: ComF family protein [Thermotogota bacterium]